MRTARSRCCPTASGLRASCGRRRRCSTRPRPSRPTAGLRNYLELRADALVSDDYRASDMAWLDMKDNRIDLVIGPIETYEDRLFGYKAAYEAYVLVKDMAWSKRLARYAAMLPELQRGLPVPDSLQGRSRGHATPTSTPTTSSTTPATATRDRRRSRSTCRTTSRCSLRRARGACSSRTRCAPSSTRSWCRSPTELIADGPAAPRHLRCVLRGHDVPRGRARARHQEHDQRQGHGARGAQGARRRARGGQGGRARAVHDHEAPRARRARGQRSRTTTSPFSPASSARCALARHRRTGRRTWCGSTTSPSSGAFTRDAASGRYRVDMTKMRNAVDGLSELILRLQGDGDYDGVARLNERARRDRSAVARRSRRGWRPARFRSTWCSSRARPCSGSRAQRRDEHGRCACIEGRPRDLGGFSVRRLLPAAGRARSGRSFSSITWARRRSRRAQGVDVRPHPHIGLATVTYLFEGELMHRDSLGTVQVIRPGDVNWMVAGRGIVHSERTPPASARRAAGLHGCTASRPGSRCPARTRSASPRSCTIRRGRCPSFARPGACCGSSPARAWGAAIARRGQLADAVRGGRARGGRGARAARRRTRSAPSMSRRAPSRSHGERHEDGELVEFAAGPAAVRALADSRVLMLLGGAPLDGRASHLVELRLELRGAYRARQAGVARRAFCTRAGRNRAHPAARSLIGPTSARLSSARPSVKRSQAGSRSAVPASVRRSRCRPCARR